MSFETCKDVWVFIECFQGEPKSVGLELLGQGRKLADGLKQKLCAVVIGKDVDAAVKNTIPTPFWWEPLSMAVISGPSWLSACTPV